MNMNMNRLPVPTWNHLGVNFAPDKAALPQVPANGWGTAAARNRTILRNSAESVICRCPRRRACGHPHQRPGD